ncbi:hypothetical protein SAMN05519103_09487 [Rhizobiales bacterium GAS113]|nr:hypothetical protein SAMN05519103_09487 [Rhizobiales bacterium GAS113]
MGLPDDTSPRSCAASLPALPQPLLLDELGLRRGGIGRLPRGKRLNESPIELDGTRCFDLTSEIFWTVPTTIGGTVALIQAAREDEEDSETPAGLLAILETALKNLASSRSEPHQ